LRQQFNSKRYNIVLENICSHFPVATAADEVKVERAVPCALLDSGGEAANIWHRPAERPIHLQKIARRKNFVPFAASSSAKSELCLRHWIEHSRSEGGTRSPLRVAKFRRRSRTYLASSGGAADPPSKIARLTNSALSAI
jgi:hypothetical protein